MTLLPKLPLRHREDRQAELFKRAMHKQAVMGGKLFGPIPEGRRREFFCLDERTWVWHEEWHDEDSVHHAVTTRYDIRPQGIVKSQGTNTYQLVRGAELTNFYRATTMYRDTLHASLDAAHAA